MMIDPTCWDSRIEEPDTRKQREERVAMALLIVAMVFFFGLGFIVGSITA